MGRRKNGSVSTTKEGIAFNAIRARCNNPKNRAFQNYGARGIKCLYLDLNDFLSDVGYAPSKEHTIDRIENDGNYERGNCRWVTMKEQARNKRSNVFITFNGITKVMSDWASELNIPISTIHNRILAGSKNPLASIKKNWCVSFCKERQKYRARFFKVFNGKPVSKRIGDFLNKDEAEQAAMVYAQNYQLKTA